jgi:hypothetical protein
MLANFRDFRLDTLEVSIVIFELLLCPLNVFLALFEGTDDTKTALSHHFEPSGNSLALQFESFK